MLRILATSLVLWSVVITGTFAQGIPGGSTDSMAFFADVMVNADEPAHRSYAQEQFHVLMHSALESESSMSQSFSTLKWVRQLWSPDSTLRLLTWELRKSDSEFRYYGYVQFLDETGAYHLVELDDTRPLRSEYGTHTPDTWYGALYYGMMEFTSNNSPRMFLLVGFNAHNDKTNIKVADIMTLDGGDLTFGAEIFVDSTETRSRVLIEYADAALARMQFDREQDKLLYDHIVVIPRGPEGPVMVPDGSYHGYELKKGKWMFIDKVFTQKVDEPPGEGLDMNKSLDIMGRERKN